jgi:glycosyltransferase involved in cell wall biosynthesis
VAPGVTGAMRVLILGSFLPWSVGSRAVSEDLGERLAAEGWEVLMRSRRRRAAPRLLDSVASAWRLRSRYAVALVDVYSGRAFCLAEAACWALRRARKPYILALHGGGLPGFARRWPRRVRRLVESAALVTAPSGYLVEELRALHPRVHVVPNPIALARYPFRARAALRPRLVWLRAFHRVYDPVLACQALACLRVRFPGARLIMIGPDKRDGSLDETRRAVAALGLGGHVVLPGPVPKADVPRWLSPHDVLLNTARVDNAPVTLLEAQACGLCVVTTGAGGLRYVLTDGEDALVTPDRAPEGLAGAVERLLAEPELAERLSRSGRRRAERHDWSDLLPRWRTLFQTAAAA